MRLIKIKQTDIMHINEISRLLYTYNKMSHLIILKNIIGFTFDYKEISINIRLNTNIQNKISRYIVNFGKNSLNSKEFKRFDSLMIYLRDLLNNMYDYKIFNPKAKRGKKH